jgi:hypothetical protein
MQHLPKSGPSSLGPRPGRAVPAALGRQWLVAWCDTDGVNSWAEDRESEPDGGPRRFGPRDEFAAESQVVAAVDLDAFRADQIAAQYDSAAVDES